jgi:hypothetical protein
MFGKKPKFSCIRYSEDCTAEGGKVVKSPKGRCLSLVKRDFGIETAENPSNYAVYDPQLERWICYVPLENKHVPFFPFLLEYARKAAEETGRVVTYLFLKTPCGYLRIKVSPKLTDVSKKIETAAAKEKESLRSLFGLHLRDIIDSFRKENPFFVLTNSEETKKILTDSISNLPEDERARLTEAIEKNVEVRENPVVDIVEEVWNSPNVHVPRETPKSLILLAVVLTAAAVGGGILYKQHVEKERMLRARERAALRHAEWRPSPVFKRNHLAYLFLPASRDVERVIEALYPPNGYKLKSAFLNQIKETFTYETPFPAVGAVKKGGSFEVKRTFKRTPKPKWASLRGKKAETIPPMTETIKRFAPYVVSVQNDSVDGVPVLSAKVSVSRKLTPADLKKMLEKIKSTPVSIEQMSVQLKDDGMYAFEFRGKIYGLEDRK